LLLIGKHNDDSIVKKGNQFCRAERKSCFLIGLVRCPLQPAAMLMAAFS